jgi:hypothetical protein
MMNHRDRHCEIGVLVDFSGGRGEGGGRRQDARMIDVSFVTEFVEINTP